MPVLAAHAAANKWDHLFGEDELQLGADPDLGTVGDALFACLRPGDATALGAVVGSSLLSGSSPCTLELSLLLCLIMPLLGITLLRSLASLSTMLFCLATALCPLHELVSRTSTLHSQVHADSAHSLSRDQNNDTESTEVQFNALHAQVVRLELAVAQLAAPDREDALALSTASPPRCPTTMNPAPCPPRSCSLTAKSSVNDDTPHQKRGDHDYVKCPENVFILFRRNCVSTASSAPSAASDTRATTRSQRSLSSNGPSSRTQDALTQLCKLSTDPAIATADVALLAQDLDNPAFLLSDSGPLALALSAA
ncbi:hypothetical protein B0H14DRAFT_3424380 [Mycena olivaceomarginata]|nr:hypothetical protein B0H14DRAFT_3424380 [Mycena olivaceomarginata]